MSYILDALRKSEQSRQKERIVPNLDARHGPMEEPGDERERERWLWLALAVLLILCCMVVWLLWDKWSADNRQDVKPPIVQSVSPNVDVNINESTNRELLSSAQGRTGRSGQEQSDSVEPSSHVPQQDASLMNEAPVYWTDTSSAPRNVSSLPVTNQDPSGLELQAFAESGSIVITPDSQGAINEDFSSSSQHNSRSQPVHWSDLPRFNELPVSIQSRVPTMSITSHTFSSDPSFCSVVVNGQKYRQGDRFQGLKLQQVTEDGAVFSIDGHRFHERVLSTWGSH